MNELVGFYKVVKDLELEKARKIVAQNKNCVLVITVVYCSSI